MDYKTIIKDNNITSHADLQRYLADISNCKYYYSYLENAKGELERYGLLSKCELVEFDGVSRYYECVKPSEF